MDRIGAVVRSLRQSCAMFTPDAFHVVLRNISRILAECEIPFLMTGGFATIYYSEPRLTIDVDLVVDPGRMLQHVDSFLESLESESYVFDAGVIRDAVAHGRM